MDLIDISISIDTLEDLTVKQLDKIVNLWSARSGCELDSGGLNYAAAKRKVFYLENMKKFSYKYTTEDAEKAIKIKRDAARSKLLGSLSRFLSPKVVKSMTKKYAFIKTIVNLSKKVLSNLGPDPTRGAAERMYQVCLAHEMQHVFGFSKGTIVMERTIDMYYPPKPKGVSHDDYMDGGNLYLGRHNRTDIEFMRWIIELKNVECLNKACQNQLCGYLRQCDEKKDGLLINFSRSRSVVEWSYGWVS